MRARPATFTTSHISSPPSPEGTLDSFLQLYALTWTNNSQSWAGERVTWLACGPHCCMWGTKKQSGITVFSKLLKWKSALIIHDIKQGWDPERAHLQLNAGGSGDSGLFSMCLGNGVGEGWRTRGHQWTAAGVPQSQPSTCCYHFWQTGPGPGTNNLSLTEIRKVDCTYAHILWHVSDSLSIWTKHVAWLVRLFPTSAGLLTCLSRFVTRNKTSSPFPCRQSGDELSIVLITA